MSSRVPMYRFSGRAGLLQVPTEFASFDSGVLLGLVVAIDRSTGSKCPAPSSPAFAGAQTVLTASDTSISMNIGSANAVIRVVTLGSLRSGDGIHRPTCAICNKCRVARSQAVRPGALNHIPSTGAFTAAHNVHPWALTRWLSLSRIDCGCAALGSALGHGMRIDATGLPIATRRARSHRRKSDGG